MTQQPKYPIDNIIRIEKGSNDNNVLLFISLPTSVTQNSVDATPVTPSATADSDGDAVPLDQSQPAAQYIQKSFEFTQETTLKQVSSSLMEEFPSIESIEFFIGRKHVPLVKTLLAFSQPSPSSKDPDAKPPHPYIRINGEWKYKVEDEKGGKHKKGISLFKDNKYAKSVQAFNTHLKRYPQNVRTMGNRALALLRLATMPALLACLRDVNTYWAMRQHGTALEDDLDHKLRLRRARALRHIATDLFNDQIESNMTYFDVVQQIDSSDSVENWKLQEAATEQATDATVFARQRAAAVIIAKKSLEELIYLLKNTKETGVKEEECEMDILCLLEILMQMDQCPPICPVCRNDVKHDETIHRRSILPQKVIDDLISEAEAKQIELDDDASLLVTPKYFMCDNCNARVSKAETQFVDKVWNTIRQQPATEFVVKDSSKFLPLVAATISYLFLTSAGTVRHSLDEKDIKSALQKLRKFISGEGPAVPSVKHYLLAHYSKFSDQPAVKLLKDYCESSPILADIAVQKDQAQRQSPVFVHTMIGLLHIVTALTTEKKLIWPPELDVNRQIDLKIVGEKKREFPAHFIKHLEHKAKEAAAAAAANASDGEQQA